MKDWRLKVDMAIDRMHVEGAQAAKLMGLEFKPIDRLIG